MNDTVKFRFTTGYATHEPVKYKTHMPTKNEIKGDGSCWFLHKWDDYFWTAQSSDAGNMGFNLKKCSKCGKVNGVMGGYGSFLRASI